MSDHAETANATVAEVFASLPRWARLTMAAVFLAECAALVAGITREREMTAVITFELPRAHGGPGFSTL